MSEEARMIDDGEPRSESRGHFRADDFYLTHAIWRNGYGGSQPETGVRSVINGVVQTDFRLIQHGCPDFDWATPLLLRLLRKERPISVVSDVIAWLWSRRRRQQSKAAWLTMHNQTISTLTAARTTQTQRK